MKTNKNYASITVIFHASTINWNKNTLKTVKLVFPQRTIDFWITSSKMCSGPLIPCFPLTFFISLKRCCLWKEHNYIMPSHNAFSFDLEALIFFCCYVIKHLSPKHILISTKTEYVVTSQKQYLYYAARVILTIQP